MVKFNMESSKKETFDQLIKQLLETIFKEG